MKLSNDLIDQLVSEYGLNTAYSNLTKSLVEEGIKASNFQKLHKKLIVSIDFNNLEKAPTGKISLPILHVDSDQQLTDWKEKVSPKFDLSKKYGHFVVPIKKGIAGEWRPVYCLPPKSILEQIALDDSVDDTDDIGFQIRLHFYWQFTENILNAFENSPSNLFYDPLFTLRQLIEKNLSDNEQEEFANLISLHKLEDATEAKEKLVTYLNNNDLVEELEKLTGLFFNAGREYEKSFLLRKGVFKEEQKSQLFKPNENLVINKDDNSSRNIYHRLREGSERLKPMSNLEAFNYMRKHFPEYVKTPVGLIDYNSSNTKLDNKKFLFKGGEDDGKIRTWGAFRRFYDKSKKKS